MTAAASQQSASAVRAPKKDAALFDAYREGLGLVAVAAIRGPNGVRIAALERPGADAIGPAEMFDGVWWCRRADHAQRIAAAVMAKPRGRNACERRLRPSIARADIVTRLAAAAKRLGIALYSDGEIAAAAASVAARVDHEIGALQRTGQFKTVNRSYRDYRMRASARGEAVRPYGEWLTTYKAKLIREIAATARQL
jgi:hypothetical protein